MTRYRCDSCGQSTTTPASIEFVEALHECPEGEPDVEEVGA